MKYGFMMGISPREPIARFPELAMQADDLGFDMAWLADSQLITKQPYLAQALAAIRTKRIKFGPGVANPVTSHYTTLANTMAGINELSEGRAVLGLGVGDSAVTPLGLKAAKVAELEQITWAIRALAAGEEIPGVDGKPPIRLLVANTPFPIFIAASQPNMLRLAGRVGDGVILMGGVNAELTAWQIEHVSSGAASVGRSLDDITIDIWFGISVSEDLAQARNDVRAWTTSQARWFSRWVDWPTVLSPFRDECAEARRQYDFSEHLSVHADHASVVSNELIDLLAPTGPVDRCVGQIAPLFDLPIDRITFTLLPGGRVKRLSALGEELIPALRSLQGVVS